MKKEKIRSYLAGFITASLIFCLCVPTIAANLQKQLTATYKDIKICIDGTYITPKDANGKTVEPFISNGTTYLPVRAVGEAFGKNVEWDGNTNTVYVGAKPNTDSSANYSRNNPAPAGVKQRITVESYSGDYTVDLEINSISRGSEAWSAIYAANRFNSKAPEGKEYILFKAKATLISAENDRSVYFNEYDFTCFDDSGAKYKREAIVQPEPEFSGDLYTGASLEGWIAVLVDKDDTSPKVVYGEDYAGQGGIWFSLKTDE